jgi:signal transduction histidine kinase/preprotein translocase subunit YajC
MVQPLLFILLLLVLIAINLFFLLYRSKKRSQDLLKKVMDSINHPFYVVNAATGKIEFANNAGRTTHVPIDAQCFTLKEKINKPCNGDACECSLKSIFKTKGHFKTDEFKIIRDGQTEYHELHGFPIFNKKGDLEKVIEYSRDITARKSAELALEKSDKELRKAIAAKDKYFSILAHDVRNPFNFLIGISELLQNDLDDISKDDLKSILGKIHKTSIQTHRIFENLLYWAQTQTGDISFCPKVMNVKDIIDDCVEMNRVFAEHKGLVIESLPNNGVYAYADVNMVKSVLRNLTLNAIKFTGKGGKIQIGVHQKNAMAEILVTDTGGGIEQNDLKRLFKIEENFSTIGTEMESGFGLGLLLSKEFVEKNNGQIFVESKPGEGSTFAFTLPLSS